MENVKLNEGFSQVCIWPATTVTPNSTPKDFEDWVLEKFGTKVQYLEEIKTLPDTGDLENKTGGRNDVFFAVHKDDIMKFAVPRLKSGIRWIEDVTSSINGYLSNPIYPERVLEYKTW